MPEEFVHLHVHSHYSLLDGCASPTLLVREAKRQGMKAIALTDHGALHGAVQFCRAARGEGIKPIIGCELYLAADSISPGDGPRREATYHLTALAMDQTGYRNLSILSSLGYLEGFYYRPRVDRELLAKHSEGLIVLSGCLAAEVPSLLAAGNYEAAKDRALWYLDTFGKERYFLELMDHDLDEQKVVNDGLLRLHRELGIELVATNDVHYLSPGDAAAQDVLVCVQTGKRLDDPDRLRFSTDQLYLRSAQEMAQRFGHLNGALSNTLKIAEQCSVDLTDSGPRLPRFGEEDADHYLRQRVFAGAVERYGEPLPSSVVDRLEHELKVIRQMGFADYFLIVWDLIRYARSQGIAVGPGRGSSASSLVAYALKITDVDPLVHGLLFERFLNPERVTMPDIDMDFCYVRRGEVLEYAVRRYGKERVAQICTFGTLAARAAIRDVGRAMGIPYGEVDKVAKLIPTGPGASLRDALHSRSELREAAESNERTRALLETSLKVEGSPRHLSVHAAGIVISPDPLVWGVPLCTTSDGTVVTQYPGEDLESLGYLKMDLLGLRTLTVIDRTLSLIERREGRRIDLDAVPLDDPDVYAALCRGDAAGVFQLETGMFRSLLKEVRPRDFADLVAILALGRPGPMVHLDEYLARRRGKKPVEYTHPAMAEYLGETYGIMLYQEQVMQIAAALAGYSPGQADLLRRAMGKKMPEIMEAERDRFLQSASGAGLAPEQAERIFEDIARFAEYGFPKSHSVAYALVAYRTAYLKVHFPIEFMAAQLSTVAAASERLGRYLQECRQAGISVRGPDINESGVEFDVDQGSIRFGLSAIKHVGKALAQEIVAKRQDGPYASIDEFCRRLAGPHLNRQALESLVRAGAFDALGARSVMLDRLDEALGRGHSLRRFASAGQIALFAEEVAVSAEPPRSEELSLAERLADEVELLGAFLSTDPLEPYQEIARLFPTPAGDDDGARRTVCGVVVGVTVTDTRRGEPMAFLNLEDAGGRSLEAVLFPNLYQKLSTVQVGDVVVVYGKIEVDNERIKLVAQAARSLGEPPWVITVEDEGALTAVYEAISAFPGDTPVILRVMGAEVTAHLAVPPRLWIDACDGLREALNRVEGISFH